MHIKQFIIILLTVLYIPLYPFGGKPIRIEEVRPYYTADDTAKIEVYIYTNKGDNTNYNYLTFTIADAIANQLEYNKTIKLQSATNYEIEPKNFEKAYDYKVFKFTNVTYTSKTEGTNITILTNYEYSTYTNWGDVRSNVKLITPETPGFVLQTNEMIFEHNGSNIILRGTNDFVQKVDIGKNYYEYFGDDIKKYVFTRDADVAVFGTVEYKCCNIYSIYKI